MQCIKTVEGRRWVARRWADGNQQLIHRKMWDERSNEDDDKDYVTVERVVGSKSRRKRWRVVVRTEEHGNSLYPPAVSPPCENVWEAMRLCRTIAALRGWNV